MGCTSVNVRLSLNSIMPHGSCPFDACRIYFGLKDVPTQCRYQLSNNARAVIWLVSSVWRIPTTCARYVCLATHGALCELSNLYSFKTFATGVRLTNLAPRIGNILSHQARRARLSHRLQSASGHDASRGSPRASRTSRNYLAVVILVATIVLWLR